MDNILDILCDYSIKGKEVDFKFLKYVFKILQKDNEDYVKYLKQRETFRHIKGTHVPMSYAYLKKTIFTQPEEIKVVHDLLYSKVQSNNWPDLCNIFLFNSYVLFILLHEFEHVDQFDKVLNPDFSIESKLLKLPYFYYSKMNEESDFAKFLIRNFHYFINNNLIDLYFKLGNFNKLFGSNILYERLADIRACEKINKLLEKVDTDIDKVRDFFELELIQYLLTGYDETRVVVFPTIRYIASLKNLNILEVNEYIDNVVIPSLSEVTSDYDRFTYGLYVTDEEIKDLRKILF